MKHILSNPHNGQPVDVLGVVLEPGFAVAVPEREANELKARFEFLCLHVEKGEHKIGSKLKPVKIKGLLTAETVTDANPDTPDWIRHVHDPKGKAPKK